MSSCEHFTQNAWRPDLCSTCQRSKSEHEEGAGPRSWRRRSEPNPNNAITGVRISALASKFQGREVRSGSIPEADGERARTLDRRVTKPKEKKLNTSRSTELLDTSASSSSSSSVHKHISSAVVSNHSKSAKSEVKTIPFKSRENIHSASSSATSSSTTTTSSSSSSSSAFKSKSSASSTWNTSQFGVKSGVSHVNGRTHAHSLTSTTASAKSSLSTATTGKSNTAHHTGAEAGRKAFSSSSSSSSKSTTAAATSSATAFSKRTESKTTEEKKDKSPNTKQTRRVSITDLKPEVIGNDGGIDNLYPEEEITVGEDDDQIYMSLTDEEKQFALLALGNTVWNSDTRNLQVEPEVAKRSCREFEDLNVNELLTTDRFKALVDCDALKSQQDFGTYPQINKSKHSKVSLENLHFSAENGGKTETKVGKETTPKASNGMDGKVKEKSGGKVGSTVTATNSHSRGHVQSQVSVERLKSAASSGTSGNSSMTSLSSDNEGRGNHGSSCGSADSGVEMGSGNDQKERPLSYTVGDITDCLYESLDDPSDDVHRALASLTKTHYGKSSLDSTADTHPAGHPPVKTRSATSSAERKSPGHAAGQGHSAKATPKREAGSDSHGVRGEEDDPGNFEISLNDSTTLEGFQAIALLNDVLRDYGDLNESSTDDFDTKDGKKDGSKAKKSSDFEARMASVAATLDLTKQRGKRQAPRPPVSPPPEPNISQAVSPKKVINQPDPVFKMVTVGKNIMPLPPQQDMVPKNSKPSQAPPGLEEFGVLGDSTDAVNNRTNGDGKNKKGITSFFRNILRRGKDSQESFESMNPDVQLSAKQLERKDSSGVCGSVDLQDDDPTSSSVDRKLGPKFSPQAKFLVIPPTSPPNKRGEGGAGDTDGTTALASGHTLKSSQSLDSDTHHQSPAIATTTSTSSAAVAAGATSAANASPPTQRKTSKGLASPKMMLKRATAKLSPPTSRHNIKHQDKDHAESTPNLPTTAAAATANKPYPAPKPAVPPPAKPPVTATTSSGSTGVTITTVTKDTTGDRKDSDATSAPNVVRRRAKSPKRTAPPVPPTRTSVGTGKSAGSDSRNPDLAKELEWRLSKTAADQSGGGTLSRESTRRSMPVPPSPPGERKDKSGRPVSPSPPISPIRETENSLPSSPSSPTGTSFDFPNTEWSGGSTSTIEDEPPKFTEKIELPTVATQGRKGFLGKLAGGNRKTRAPQPPSVKRAKSITESSTLPRGDKKSKKINVADISGPVMVTDITNTKVLENRRNTISLGDEPAFVTLSAVNQGGTTSTASVDKSGFDEFDFPVLSPLGSLENLYESILPKQEGSTFHYYDPPTSPKVLCPNIPADGYLEPVPPLSSTTNAAAVAALGPASSSLSSAPTTATNLPLSSSSSTSSASSATTNASVVKSPNKSKTSVTVKPERATTTFPGMSKDSSSSHSSHPSSASSSEANSAENSGNSLPDPAHISGKTHGDSTGKMGGSSLLTGAPTSTSVGPSFVEPEMTEQRRILLASQPIYEEIPNGGNEDIDDFENDQLDRRKGEEKKRKTSASRIEVGPPRKGSISEGGGPLQKVMLPGMVGGGGEMTKSQIAHAWLQQPHAPGQQSSGASVTGLSTPTSHGVLPTSPSHIPSKPHQAPTSLSLSMTASQMMTSSLMATSLTSSMLPPPPPPPDQLPAPHPSTSRSVSRETVSSESDTQSNCSTLSRPRPAPRRKPKRPDTGGSDQYVSMNRPNAQVSLSEDKLRDVFTKLTSITFHALQDIYAQCERILSVDRLDIPNSKMLKWADFDIYGQPLHASGRCVVYNAKLRANNAPCQIMILHSRPATEMCTTSHPSLLRPSAVFADTIPFSYLTPDFIKTSQLLQNSVYDSSQARCFVAVGAFDVVESLDSHLALLRETLAQDLNAYLNVILTAALQLLSAMSHCLDQGFSVTETDYNDVFLITRSDLRGKVVAFLPHQRSLDVPQGEAMCNFLDRLLTDAMPIEDDDDMDDDEDDDEDEVEGERIVSSPKRVIAKLRSLLEPRRVECLGQVRTAVEYLLWGPAQSELPISPAGAGPKPIGGASTGAGGGASREQELYVWLEKERVSTVGRLARNVPGLGAGLSLEEFYTLKFLLKSSAACLAESLRRLSR